MITTVANVYTYKGDMTGAAYVGRPTIYGNPFRGPGALDQFREYWYADAQVYLRERAFRELDGLILLCWCFPAPCHASIIADWLNHKVIRVGMRA